MMVAFGWKNESRNGMMSPWKYCRDILGEIHVLIPAAILFKIPSGNLLRDKCNKYSKRTDFKALVPPHLKLILNCILYETIPTHQSILPHAYHYIPRS